jgi:hypothetical protein
VRVNLSAAPVIHSSVRLGQPPAAHGGQTRIAPYKPVYVLNDQEVGNFSDEVIVNCQT